MNVLRVTAIRRLLGRLLLAPLFLLFLPARALAAPLPASGEPGSQNAWDIAVIDLELAQPWRSRDHYVVACCVGECTAIGCKGDVVNGAVRVIGKLTCQCSSSHIPKTNG
jgi:hypothetical protein